MIKRKIDELVGLHKYSEALKLLEPIIAEEPDNVMIYSMLGDISQHVDKTEAIVYYRNGLEREPKNPYLNTALGFLYFNLKDFVNAEKHFIESWIEDPTNIKLLTALGKIYKSWKHYEKAIKYYRICELLDPLNPFAIYGIADAYRGLGNNSTALQYWLKFHMIEPNNKVAITRIGDCFLNLNDLENALAYYQKALTIGYDYFAYIGTAKVHLARKNTEDALEIFEKISDREQGSSRYFYEFICVCLEAGMKEKAKHLHDKATKCFPGNAYIEILSPKISKACRI